MISPGPWRWDNGRLLDAHGREILELVPTTYIPPQEWDDDAQAIALVPEMLELLRENPGEDCSSAACGTCWHCRKDALRARLSPQEKP